MHPLPLATLPIVGGLAFSLEEQQARAAKRNRARRRFEQRNARLHREEQQKLAERQARAQRAMQHSEVTLDPVQAALERVRAQKAANADAALKKAKVDLAMSRAQLNKSLKAFGHPPTFEQQSQLIVLQQQFEAAEQALLLLESSAPVVATPPVPTNDAELKRAKIQLAMRRAELKKAQTNEAPAEQITALQHALSEAERQVDAYAAP
jgi:electron transport complex protein RnfB